MKAIRQRLRRFAALTGFGLIISVLMFVFGFLTRQRQIQLLSAAALLASCVLAWLWVREANRLRYARLIAENAILHIRPAVIDDRTGGDAEAKSAGGIEVFVSYFGILLDSKAIRFNQDGVLLQGVEIGRDFITLTYGAGQKMQTTRLLHEEIENRQLQDIVERFRFETGVVPTVTN